MADADSPGISKRQLISILELMGAIPEGAANELELGPEKAGHGSEKQLQNEEESKAAPLPSRFEEARTTLFPAGTDESLVAGEENFVPLSAWTAEDLSNFVAKLGTDVLYQRAAALIFHFGLDGFTLEAEYGVSGVTTLVENDLELGDSASPVLRRVLAAHMTRLLSRGGGPLHASVSKSADGNDDDDDLNTTLDDTVDESIQSPGSIRENSSEGFIEDGHSTSSDGDDDDENASSPAYQGGAGNQQVIHLDQFMHAVQAMIQQQQQNEGDEGAYEQDFGAFAGKRNFRGGGMQSSSSSSYARAAARQMAQAEAEEQAWRQRQRGPVPVVKRIGGGYFVGYGKPGGPTTPGGRPQLTIHGGGGVNGIGRAVGYGPTGWGRLPMALRSDPASRPGTQERLALVSQRREAWLAQKQLRQEWQAAGGQGPVPQAFALCPEGARARSYAGFGFGGGGGGSSDTYHRYNGGGGAGKRPRADVSSAPQQPPSGGAMIGHHEPMLALPPSPAPAAAPSHEVQDLPPSSSSTGYSQQDYQSAAVQTQNQHRQHQHLSNRENTNAATATSVSFMHRGTLTGPSLTNFAPDGSMGSIQEASSDENDSSEDGDNLADEVNACGNDGDGGAMDQDASASSDLDARIEAAIAHSMASLGHPSTSTAFSSSQEVGNEEQKDLADAAAPAAYNDNASSSSDSAYLYGRSKNSPPTPGHALAPPPPEWPEGHSNDDEDEDDDDGQFQDARAEQVATPKVTFKPNSNAVHFADEETEDESGDADQEAATSENKPIGGRSGGGVGLSPTMQLFGRNKHSPPTPGHALAPALPAEEESEDEVDGGSSANVAPKEAGPVTVAPSAIGGKKKKIKNKNKTAGGEGPKVRFDGIDASTNEASVVTAPGSTPTPSSAPPSSNPSSQATIDKWVDGSSSHHPPLPTWSASRVVAPHGEGRGTSSESGDLSTFDASSSSGGSQLAGGGGGGLFHETSHSGSSGSAVSSQSGTSSSGSSNSSSVVSNAVDEGATNDEEDDDDDEEEEEVAPEVGGRARLLNELFELARSGNEQASSSSSPVLSRSEFNHLGRVLAAAGVRGGALDYENSDSDGSEVEDEEAAVLASAVHLDETAFQTLCGAAASEDESLSFEEDSSLSNNYFIKKDAEHREALLKSTGAPPLRPKAPVPSKHTAPPSIPSGLSFDRFSAVFESAPDLATLGAARDLLVRARHTSRAFSSLKAKHKLGATLTKAPTAAALSSSQENSHDEFSSASSLLQGKRPPVPPPPARFRVPGHSSSSPPSTSSSSSSPSSAVAMDSKKKKDSPANSSSGSGTHNSSNMSSETAAAFAREQRAAAALERALAAASESSAFSPEPK